METSACQKKHSTCPFPSSFTDQAFLALKRESVFQNPFSRNSLIQQFRVVFFLLNLLQGVRRRVFQRLFAAFTAEQFELQDDGG